MKCPKCNAEIADNAKFCPECGAKVEKIEPIKICPNCGSTIKDGAKFCLVCGTKIVSSYEETSISSAVCKQTDICIENTSKSMSVANSTEKAKRLKKSDKIIIIVAIVVFVVTTITIIGTSLSSNSGNQSYYDDLDDSYNYSSNSDLSNTYNNRYISFRYPDNYIITDEEEDEDGEISLSCEIKGEDFSDITIISGEDVSLYVQDEQELNETCMETLRSLKSVFMSNIMYDDVNFYAMSKKTIGNCEGFYSNYTAKVSSYPIKGYIFVGVSGYYYVIIMTQAENDRYTRQLDDILSTLDVKAVALGIGDMADDD